MRFAVVIDKAVPSVAYGPHLLVEGRSAGTIIGDFEDLGLAEAFVVTVREVDRTRGLGLGPPRIYDHKAAAFVAEST